MNFKEYISEAWSSHRTNPKKVADEFKQNFNLMETEEDVMSMTRLIVHVCGDHLGDWLRGIELLRKIKNNATISDSSEMNRYMAILNLGNNPNTAIENFSPSDQARIYASTASALVTLGGLKNAEKFLKLAEEISSHLLKDDPANQAVAIAANNIACALYDKTECSSSEIELMIFASTTARKYWEIAGTWKEIERAEYRLANTYLKAESFDKALIHARACLDIVSENKSEPIELFFAYEVLALVEKARNNMTVFQNALEQMKVVYSGFSTEEQDNFKNTFKKFD